MNDMNDRSPPGRLVVPDPVRAPFRGVEGLAALPRGARDLLPVAARRRRAVIQRLLTCFERWGYAQVMTPSIEYSDVFGRGLGPGDQARCVRFIEPGSGELVTLRSDITPQIARMVAQRHGGEIDPDLIVRFCYAADVVRQPDGRREQAEHHQVGVELIGDFDPEGDVELIVLCHEALQELGLTDVRIDLAHAAVGREILRSVDLPAQTLEVLHGLLARKDADGTARLLETAGVDRATRHAVSALCSLYGPPEVLDRARQLLRCEAVVNGLDRLEAVIEGLRAAEPAALERVVLDLGEVRGFDYYTGLRLRVWAPGVANPVVQGGRYNDLLGRFGVSLPATGFVADLDALEAALEHAGVSLLEAKPSAACLVVVGAAAKPRGEARLRQFAASLAREARNNGERAWIELGLTNARALDVARKAGADRVVFVEDHEAGPRASAWQFSEGTWSAVQFHHEVHP